MSVHQICILFSEGGDEFSDFVASRDSLNSSSSFMPSQLFDLSSLYAQNTSAQGT
jgi:hypothetical protein